MKVLILVILLIPCIIQAQTDSAYFGNLQFPHADTNYIAKRFNDTIDCVITYIDTVTKVKVDYRIYPVLSAYNGSLRNDSVITYSVDATVHWMKGYRLKRYEYGARLEDLFLDPNKQRIPKSYIILSTH